MKLERGEKNKFLNHSKFNRKYELRVSNLYYLKKCYVRRMYIILLRNRHKIEIDLFRSAENYALGTHLY